MLPLIGKYSIEKVLGEGGFGKVYLGFDPDVGQPVAIKKLRAAGDPDLLRRFQLEIRTTASLRHKNIVTIHASGEEAGDPYLVMEFLEGHTLKQVIQGRRPLTLLEKVRIMTQVAEGLAYAHSKGVVHRDVKPENIMLLPDDNVKIMDFGIALGPNRNMAVTQTGGIIGTPPYFAPEQLDGVKANEQTDIFSFGDVYYELLTGNHPFEQFKGEWQSLQLAIMTYEPSSVGELVPGCPEALELLVHRTLAKAPAFRYQKFEELQLDSEAILVDLRHEGAATILREVRPLLESGHLQTAELKVRQAYQLDPGNREARRLREEINLRIQKGQVQARVDELLSEAERQMGERRYAEAVQSLESGIKLDSGNVSIGQRLQEARSRLDSSNRANCLVSEARLKQQKGLLDEARELFQAALVIDPDHTDARRLSHRVSDELERRRLDQQRQQAIRSAREHLAAKEFAEALAILDEIDRKQAEAGGVGELRAEIQQRQAEEGRRLRAENFNLALARTREAMQAGELERAGSMVDRLFATFAAEPGAEDVLQGLRQRLQALIRTKEIAQYQQKARGLLREKAFPEALALLAEALGKFQDDAGLERMHKAAGDLYQAHQRSEAVAAVLREATTKRDAGDGQGALNTILEGRQRLGEEAAFVDLSRQLEMEIEQQRYSAGLESLFEEARGLLAARRYSEAVDHIESAKEFSGEAEARALLEEARAAAAMELEQRFVAETLAAAAISQSRGAWNEALEAVERGLSRYPHSTSLAQTADRLRDGMELERRQSSIARHRATIRVEIEDREWQRAAAALRKARSELPGDTAFDDMADQVEAGLFDAGLHEVEARIRENLAANAVSQAEQNLNATRTVYAHDPRWKVLEQEVARRLEYESALRQADRKRNASRLSEAEELLTAIINQGPPDKRAGQMRDAIRMQRSEAVCQAEILRIAEEIRERLKRDDLLQARSELAVARARYPGESSWMTLSAEIEARREPLRLASIAAFEAGVRECLSRHDLEQALARLAAARKQHPGENPWTALQAEIDALDGILKRQAEVAADGERVRQDLNRDDLWQARAQREREIEEVRGRAEILLTEGKPEEAVALIESRFAREPRLEGLRTWGRQALEQQRRREARSRDRDRLLSIERGVQSESRRKRRELDREAHRIADGYVEDEEMAAIAARIPALVEAASALPARRWFPVIAAALVVASGAAAVWLLPPVRVRVSAQPAGASITVDGRPCASPCTIGLRAGPHDFEAKLQGYEPGHQRSEIRRRAPGTVTELALSLRLIPPVLPLPNPAAPNGTLEINCSADGATVGVDGQRNQLPAGQTRLRTSLPPGRHQLRLAKQNYRTLEEGVDIRSGATTTRAFTLQPLPALLDIVGYPPDTEISIDGSPRASVGSNGKLAGVIEVVPGSHDVKLSHEGYEPLEMRRPFVPNEKVSYRADSERLIAIAKAVGEPLKKRTDPDAAIAQEWSRLENSGDVNAIDAFRTKHPGTQWGSKAGDRINQIDDQDWKTALQANSIQALDDYSSKHRNGRHVLEASQHITDAVWNRVNKSDAQALRAFIEQYPNSPHKAEAQPMADQLERQRLDAEQRAKQERAQHAQAPNEANARGVTFFKAQRYEEAIVSFTEAIRSKPDLANAYFNRGAAYYKLGQFQSAISDFDQTLALNPQDQSAAFQKQQAQKRLASGVYFAGKDVTTPAYLSWTNPKYSKEAIRAGKTGTVLLTFVVDEYGRVKDCQVLRSLTPDLDQRAVDAASHAKFKPGTKRGKPVPVEVTVEVKFDQP